MATDSNCRVSGASAYTGAAKLLQNPAFVTSAASILATEARQSAWISSTVRGLNPWSTEFEVFIVFISALFFVLISSATRPLWTSIKRLLLLLD
jgi:hypothetical protein